jgi:hypothetical protein
MKKWVEKGCGLGSGRGTLVAEREGEIGSRIVNHRFGEAVNQNGAASRDDKHAHHPAETNCRQQSSLNFHSLNRQGEKKKVEKKVDDIFFLLSLPLQPSHVPPKISLYSLEQTHLCIFFHFITHTHTSIHSLIYIYYNSFDFLFLKISPGTKFGYFAGPQRAERRSEKLEQTKRQHNWP